MRSKLPLYAAFVNHLSFQGTHCDFSRSKGQIRCPCINSITAIEDSLKAEMLAKNTDVLSGKDYTITWKTVITNRFDSAAFKLTHADLFAQFSRSSTSRRFVIA